MKSGCRKNDIHSKEEAWIYILEEKNIFEILMCQACDRRRRVPRI